MKIKQWRTIHRYSGLLIVAFLLIYTFSGILLNHRKFFNNFLLEKHTLLEKPLSDPQLLRSFIDQCKAQIGNDREPKIIIIRDLKNIDFRYDRHGNNGFILNPEAGTITAVTKRAREPWHAMKWLHVAYMTTPIWIVVSDIIALIILLTVLSGLYCIRYRRSDVIIALGGFFIFVTAVLIG
jgi:uncharacterized iron-regulated membrane protein